MPRQDDVYCAHCDTKISRKRERAHRRLLVAPYTSPRKSNAREPLLFSDSESSDEALSSHDQSGVHLDGDVLLGASDSDFYDAPGGTDAPSDELDLPVAGEPFDSDEETFAPRVMGDRWSLRKDPDEDSDSGSEEDDEVVDAGIGEDPDEDYVTEWARIESRYDLSAWERLGEGFEQEVAGISDRLTQYEHAICRAFAYKVSTHSTDSDYEKLPFAFPIDPPLPGISALRTKIAALSGIKPEVYDCCPNSCCCYLGPHKELRECPYCKEPRFRADGRPRKRFTYIPLIPRLVAFASNSKLAQQMQYRAEYKHTPGVTSDVFDGTAYRKLRTKYVEINGRRYDFKYFSHILDIALGLSTDGFAPFRNRKSTAWPLIIFNYNLPPDIRFHIENILSLGVIPGPKKPVDADSFLIPFVTEMEQLAEGVRAFDALTSSLFSLRAYLILVFGDIPAVSMLMRMKGHNGLSPCRMCEITGLRVPNSRITTHYVPHHRLNYPGLPEDAPRDVDMANLPLRHHRGLLSQAYEVQSAAVTAESNRLAKKYGIKGIPLLSHLKSLSFPVSFPYDFMHLIWENLVKNLILHWTGQFKGLDSGRENYTISKAIWDAIGTDTSTSGSFIPSSYGSRCPDIAAKGSQYSAEMYSFWTLYIGPVLLKRRLDAKYYLHFIHLVRLLTVCLQFEITDDEVEEVRQGFIEWVRDYETIFYQHDPSRLSTCPVTIHALLHIADSIKAMGPVWCYWAFPMERYCGRLQPAIRSRRFPYASIDRYVVEDAQLTQIKVVHGMHEELLLRPPRGTVAGAFKAPEYPTCMLIPPRRQVDSTDLHSSVAAALATRFTVDGSGSAVRVAEVRQYLRSHAVIEEWGKVRRIDSDEGDTMHSASMISVGDDSRDATYVRYEMTVDKNARRRNAPIIWESGTFYGQLRHIIVVHCQAASDQLGILGPTAIILAAIRTCKVEDKNTLAASVLDIHDYSAMGELHVTDITGVQCLVGRVKDGSRWSIIDRSGSLARAIHEHEGN